MLQLTNPETAARYEALTTIDQKIYVPARKGQGSCWKGMISAIPPDAAARYVKMGGNLIKEK